MLVRSLVFILLFVLISCQPVNKADKTADEQTEAGFTGTTQVLGDDVALNKSALNSNNSLSIQTPRQNSILDPSRIVVSGQCSKGLKLSIRYKKTPGKPNDEVWLDCWSNGTYSKTLQIDRSYAGKTLGGIAVRGFRSGKQVALKSIRNLKIQGGSQASQPQNYVLSLDHPRVGMSFNYSQVPVSGRCTKGSKISIRYKKTPGQPNEEVWTDCKDNETFTTHLFTNSRYQGKELASIAVRLFVNNKQQKLVQRKNIKIKPASQNEPKPENFTLELDHPRSGMSFNYSQVPVSGRCDSGAQISVRYKKTPGQPNEEVWTDCKSDNTFSLNLFTNPSYQGKVLPSIAVRSFINNKQVKVLSRKNISIKRASSGEGLKDIPITGKTTGFSTYSLSGGARIIYVSSSSGNDSYDGLSTAKPVRTLDKARKLLRPGMGDWMLLKSGDSWSEKLGLDLTGRSLQSPAIISRYGKGKRPILKKGIFLWGDYGVIEGIHFLGDRSHQTAIVLTPQSSVQNLRIENCLIEKFGDGITVERDASKVKGKKLYDPHRNIVIHRTVIADSTPQKAGHKGRSSGMYVANVNGFTLSESILDQNGYQPDLPKDHHTVFSHNAYIAEYTLNVKAVGNISSRASSDGLKLRGGGLFKNNLLVSNPLSMTACEYDFSCYNGDNSHIEMKDNVVLHGSMEVISGYGGGDRGPRNWGIYIKMSKFNNERKFTWDIKNNIFAHAPTFGDSSSRVGSVSQDIDLPNGNTVYKWGNSDNIGTNFKDPERTLDRYIKEVLKQNRDRNWFFNEMRKQHRENWRYEFTADSVNNYIRNGFQRK